MAGIEFDTSQLDAFTARLEAAPRATEKQVAGVVKRGAENIKKQLRGEMSESRHFGQIAPTINYDIRSTSGFGGGVVEAEIGPNRHWRAARLANIAYFGTSRGGGTVPDPDGALQAEVPNVMDWLTKAAEGAL